MKKLLMVILAVLMLGLLTVTAQAATREIVIASITGSPNTAPTGPVQYLNDGNPGTAWSSAAETTGPLWAELTIGKAAMIDGLQIYGQYQGDLKIEYWQDNGWHSFLAARSIPETSVHPGWNLIDLSYDRIATHKIRLSLTANQAVQLGGIGEIKILGRQAADVIQRLDPVTVGESSRSQYGYPVTYLFDHNSYTDWRVYAGGPTETTSLADLGEVCSIGRIKVYTTPKSGSDSYQGQFKMQYQYNDNWYDLPGVSINLNRMTKGWQSFDVSGGNISASKLRVVLNGQQIMGGIKEVEIWGYRGEVTGSSYYYSGSEPAILNVGQSGNYAFDLEDISSGTYNLHLSSTGGTSDLTWELNGYPMGTLRVSSVKDGVVFYHTPIDTRRLQVGTNYIRISGSGITVTDCRIEKVTTYTLGAAGSGLTDRWLLTPASGNENLIDLGGSFHLDQLILQYLGSQPTVQIAVLQNGQWINLSGSSANSSDNLGGQLIYSGVGQATQIRVSYDSGSASNGPSELLLYGSEINDGAPKIKITSPLDGDVFTLSEWGQGSFCATLDNPDVTLQLNGQTTYFLGTAIKLPLPQLGTPQGEQIIKAVVTDSQGRTGSDTITISVSTPPDFTINLPEGITYTSETKILISGTVVISTSQITINGTAVPVQNNKFSTSYSLSEGLNLLTVKLTPRAGSTQVNTLVRKVVRTGSAPYLRVQYPADGQVVKDAQVAVSGEVSSLTTVKVTVNGKAATVSSGSFYSSPVTLAEGANKLTVIATDQNGRTSTTTLTVQRDGTAPVLSAIIPAEGAYLNTLTVTVSGKVSDASPVAVLVNGQAATLTGSQFSATVAVQEGANVLKIAAGDSAGNTANVTRNVSIDTGAPDAFTPTASASSWTNNNKPTITFSTTDSESGIDHYEIGVVGGTTSGSVTSPYTFTTAIADGEHTVQVKAVDRAGNYTVGEVKVYIDTVAPSPVVYTLIPGNGSIELRWGDEPNSDIIQYEISRTPAFSGGSVVTLAVSQISHITDNSGKVLDVYKDTSVQNGTTYVYKVTAIDRGGNRSSLLATVPQIDGQVSPGIMQDTPVTAGMIEQVIPAGKAGAVMFDSGGIYIPADFGKETRVTIYERSTNEFPGIPYGAASPIVEFKLEAKENGTWVQESQLSQNVTICIPYNPEDVPAGCDEDSLGVAFFSTEVGMWIYDEGAVVDKENHRIFLETNHLSPHLVGVNPYVDDFSEQFGIKADTYDQSRKTIRVEENSGNLAGRFVDFSLPTPGLLQFGVTRIYNTQTAEVDQIEKMVSKDKSRSLVLNGDSQTHDLIYDLDFSEDQGFAAFGRGWRLNLPYICSKGHFHDFDNNAQQLGTIWKEPNGWKGDYHGRNEFTVEKTDDNHVILTLKNGIIMTFERKVWDIELRDGSKHSIITRALEHGRVTKIEDTVNHYWQEISYLDSDPKYVKVSKIKDSLNRELDFNYDSTGISEVVLVSPGEQAKSILSYTYDTDKVELETARNKLTGQSDTYNYQIATVRRGKKVKGWGFGIFGNVTYENGDTEEEVTGLYIASINASSLESFDVWVLNRITDELHRQDAFEYDIKYNQRKKKKHKWGFISYSKMNYKTCYDVFVVKRSYQSAGDEIRNDRSYGYIFEMQNEDNSDFNLRLSKSIFYSGQVRTEHAFTEFDEQNSLTSKDIYLNDALVEWEKFGYAHYGDNPDGEIWRVNNYQHRINGKTVSENYDYDDWGNISHRTSTGGDPDSGNDDIEEWYIYANTSPISINTTGVQSNPYSSTVNNDLHDRLLNHVALIHTPVDKSGKAGTYRKQEACRYDSSGRLERQAGWDDDKAKWLETQLIYDTDVAKPKQVIDPLLHSVYYTYDTLGNTSKTEQTVVDDDGDNHTIIQEWGYDPVWGWKLWEKDGRGYVTVYRYTKPSGEMDYRGRVWEQELPADTDPQGWDPRTGNARSGNPVVHTVYDDTKLTKTVIDQGGHKILYQYDLFGTLASVSKYRRTNGGSYESYALTGVSYDSFGRIKTITDPRANVTSFDYDDLGDITKVTYPADATDSTNSPSKTFTYDFATGGVIVRNERGYETVEYRDALGRTIRQDVENGNKVYQTVSQSFYDGAGNLVKSIDPATNVTLCIYDTLGRQKEVIPPTEDFWENGAKISVSPLIRYEYNDLGQKTAEVKTLAGGSEHRSEYQYDSLGRQIIAKTFYTDRSGSAKDVITKVYYDANGNKTQTVDANNSVLSKEERKVSSYSYSAANLLLSETDPAGNTTNYTYDAVGNRKSITDPRGNSGNYRGDFTTQFEYDDLNRLVAKYLPAAPGESQKPVIRYSYDVQGNLSEQVEPDGGKTTYTYTARNKVTSISAQGAGKTYTTYKFYDEAGNEKESKDARGYSTLKEYDAFNRLIKITYPEGNTERFEYDLRNNRLAYIDGRNFRTAYSYDNYNRVSQVKDAASGITSYYYDRNGNKTKEVNALIHTTQYSYDELDRLIWEKDSQDYIQKYDYDANGNRIYSQDRNGTVGRYDYYSNNLLQKITLSRGGTIQTVEYGYDEAGNRKWVSSGGVITQYNIFDTGYVPDPSGKVRRETQSLDGQTFTVDYDYDQTGRMIGIKYPAGQWVNYQYNTLNQLLKVPGYVEEPPVYDQSGMLTGLKAANGIAVAWEYDRNGRLNRLDYTNQGSALKNYSYTYDEANNLTHKNEDLYQYDTVNRLVYASINGSFAMDPREELQIAGTVKEDFSGQQQLEFSAGQLDLIELDYAAGSIGVDLQMTADITKAELMPDSPLHRVAARNIRVYSSADNSHYTRIKDWKAIAKPNGGLEIVLGTPVKARFLKIKSLFDNRDKQFKTLNQAQFKNTADQLIKVYYQVSNRLEQYTYDMAGNRTGETITQRYSKSNTYTYYPQSSRLKSNGKYTFEYDANGNLTKKSTITGDGIVWDYEYDLFNRLVKVSKNGAVVSQYVYDDSGLRLKKQGPDGTTYYAFDTGGNVLYEQESNGYMEYVYVNGRHFARVDGNLNNSITQKYFYHTDHLGSTVLVTDEAGEQVWSSEYLPFGGKHSTDGELEHVTQFTGKDLDSDTGLYYFNARWMDSEVGRFISEDPVEDPNNSNLYAYCADNPLTHTDPTGNRVGDNDNPQEWDVPTPTAFDDVIRGWDLDMVRYINYSIYKPLQIGDDVRFVQGSLMNLGLLNTMEKGYGKETRAAIIQFQVLAGLDADGIVGPNTLNALLTAQAYVNGYNVDYFKWQWNEMAAPLLNSFEPSQKLDTSDHGQFAGQRQETWAAYLRGGDSAVKVDADRWTSQMAMFSAHEGGLAAGGLLTSFVFVGFENILLPDNAVVVRGGESKAGDLIKNQTKGSDGTLSANGGVGLSERELSIGLPQNKISITTVGELRAKGYDVVSSPTANNPNHVSIITPGGQVLTDAEAANLQSTFTIKLNPSK